MSRLLNNPNLKRKKDPLDRGEAIEPEKKFTVEDLNENTKTSESMEQENETNPNQDSNRITFYANVRIDNHIKNKAEALSAIGLYKTQKEAIDEALDYLINSLPSEDKRRLKFQIETLEERDVRIKRKH